MSLSFPLSLASLADLLHLESAPWNLARNDTYSTLGSGEFIVSELAPPLWEAECRSVPLTHAAAEQIAAVLRALDGSSQAFYLYNPKMRYPQADPDGTTLGSSSVVVNTINANRKALTISGLPAAYVITVGDYLQIDYASSARRALLQVVETVTANGSGVTPEFEVRPHIRSGITTTLAVVLKNPSAKVKIVPDTLRVEERDAVFSSVRFTVRQTLAAS